MISTMPVILILILLYRSAGRFVKQNMKIEFSFLDGRKGTLL